ncbi:hypothetical protein Tco_1425880, partial [Tanacetum coccineum]
ALSHTSIGMDVLPCSCYIMRSNTVSIIGDKFCGSDSLSFIPSNEVSWEAFYVKAPMLIGSNACFHAATSRGKALLYDTISIKEVLAGNGVNL